MSTIAVKETECIKCGLCVDACPAKMLALKKKGPVATHNNCFSCGQCVAICPPAAINNIKTPLAEQSESKGVLPSPEETEYLLKSRRSIRGYKKKRVPREIIERLLDSARYAPTGANTQGISYLVIDTPDILAKITEASVKHMERTYKKCMPYADTTRNNIAWYRKEGKDPVLFHAPCLIIALADKVSPLAKDFPAVLRPIVNKFALAKAKENAISSLLYTQTFAPTMELGSCVSGIVTEYASKGDKNMVAAINPPADKVVVGALIIGYPAMKYPRIVERDPLQIDWR